MNYNYINDWVIFAVLTYICILQICLFSPNIVYWIHKQWFEWKNKH